MAFGATDLGFGSAWTLTYVATEWAIRLGMLVVVPFRRSPEAAKGWLLLAFILPIPALALYVVIGRPTFPGWRRKRFVRLRSLLEAATDQISHLQACRPPDLPGNFAQAANLIENLGRFPTLAGNEIELLADYEGVFDRLIADIDAAGSHVHLLMYIFAEDGTGERVVEALTRAARRGITCRVLIDALGSRRSARRVIEALSAGGVAARTVLPVGLLRRRSARADLRNHRKIVVIDSLIGYVGSQNVVDARSDSGLLTEELVARVTGPVALELQAVFAADWFLETEQAIGAADLFPHRHPGVGAVAQVLPSGPDYPSSGVAHLIVALIHGARDRVVVTTPYFIPDDALVQALETAVLRGVEVHLVLSQVTDHRLVGLAQRSYYESLLQAGIRIHLYRDHFLHAKHLSVDQDLVLIGSSNVDIRSFVLNAEVTLIVYDRELTGRLRAEQERYFVRSESLNLSAWARRPLPVKVCENMARLLSPLL